MLPYPSILWESEKHWEKGVTEQLISYDLLDNINSLSVAILVGAGSTALHYAACGGNAKCCQVCVSTIEEESEMRLNVCIMFSSLRGYYLLFSISRSF